MLVLFTCSISSLDFCLFVFLFVFVCLFEIERGVLKSTTVMNRSTSFSSVSFCLMYFNLLLLGTLTFSIATSS